MTNDDAFPIRRQGEEHLDQLMHIADFVNRLFGENARNASWSQVVRFSSILASKLVHAHTSGDGFHQLAVIDVPAQTLAHQPSDRRVVNPAVRLRAMVKGGGPAAA